MLFLKKIFNVFFLFILFVPFIEYGSEEKIEIEQKTGYTSNFSDLRITKTKTTVDFYKFAYETYKIKELDTNVTITGPADLYFCIISPMSFVGLDVPLAQNCRSFKASKVTTSSKVTTYKQFYQENIKPFIYYNDNIKVFTTLKGFRGHHNELHDQQKKINLKTEPIYEIPEQISDKLNKLRRLAYEKILYNLKKTAPSINKMHPFEKNFHTNIQEILFLLKILKAKYNNNNIELRIDKKNIKIIKKNNTFHTLINYFLLEFIKTRKKYLNSGGIPPSGINMFPEESDAKINKNPIENPIVLLSVQTELNKKEEIIKLLNQYNSFIWNNKNSFDHIEIKLFKNKQESITLTKLDALLAKQLIYKNGESIVKKLQKINAFFFDSQNPIPTCYYTTNDNNNLQSYDKYNACLAYKIIPFYFVDDNIEWFILYLNDPENIFINYTYYYPKIIFRQKNIIGFDLFIKKKLRSNKRYTKTKEYKKYEEKMNKKLIEYHKLLKKKIMEIFIKNNVFYAKNNLEKSYDNFYIELNTDSFIDNHKYIEQTSLFIKMIPTILHSNTLFPQGNTLFPQEILQTIYNYCPFIDLVFEEIYNMQKKYPDLFQELLLYLDKNKSHA